ncbi:MAG: radical SAM protein [Deltaproteobacteria bacterium]|nr:radical SAM protein [Deltaproteobacteria bacterium]
MGVPELIYPREIILEVTNRCNLACRFCHFHGQEARRTRPLGSMARATWEKVLAEISGWSQPCMLLTHGAGEPLLYPELEDLLRRAVAIPHLSVGFMTNGMLLTPAVSRWLVDLPLDYLALSIDGVKPATNDYFRRHADLRLIEENVRHLIEIKAAAASAKPVLSFNMVGYEEILDQEREYVARWLPHADQVSVATFRPVGSRRLWAPAQAPSFTPCRLLYQQLVVAWNGDVGLCCEDINLEVPLGNVVEDGLLAVFNHSETLRRYRRAHEEGKLAGLRLCADCHVWGGGVVCQEQELEIGGLRVHEISSPAGRTYRRAGCHLV